MLGALVEIIAVMLKMCIVATVWFATTVVPIVFNIIYWIVVVMIPGIIYFVWSAIGFSKSQYKSVTHNSIFDTYTDKGRLGEYLIYRHLNKQFEGAKWLFNIYIPREDGRTTEIDALMIHESGVYVFESKNYSGWIFGSYHRDQWTQCIKRDENSRAKKYHFYNPIKQNELHVKWLNALLPESVHKAISPVIVFGRRCKLKNIQLDQCDQPVLKLQDLTATFQNWVSLRKLYSSEVNEIYEMLYPYSQVVYDIKEQHVRDIKTSIGIDD